MSNIQFSVVIPLYNKRNSILQTLESVRTQRCPASEIIVVDDGSSDDGALLVAQLDWPELRLLRQPNKGVSAARNAGVAAATHNYIAFLDADDKWLPFFLSHMRDLILRFPRQALFACRYQKVQGQDLYSDARVKLTRFDPNGYVMNNFFQIASQGDLPFMVSGCVTKRHFFEKVGGFPEQEWMGEDQSFFIQAALQNRIAYTPQIQLLYSTDTDNRACDKLPPVQACPYALSALSQLNSDKLSKPTRKHIKGYYAAHLCNLAKRNVQAKQPKAALGLLSDPLCWHKPLHKIFWQGRAYVQLFSRFFFKGKQINQAPAQAPLTATAAESFSSDVQSA